MFSVFTLFAKRFHRVDTPHSKHKIKIRDFYQTCFCIAVSFEDAQFEVVPLTAEKVLEFIEEAYPNPVTPEDLARYDESCYLRSDIDLIRVFFICFKFRNHGWPEEEVLQIMLSLQTRGVIKSMEYNSFTRTHHEDTEIKASPIGRDCSVFVTHWYS